MRTAAILRTIAAVVGVVAASAPAHGQRVSPLTSVGALDAPPEAVFGQITDVSIDSDRNVYVLDALSFQLRVFDKAGRFVAAAGRRGSGPGELLAPISVAVTASGEAFVLDQSNNRIERWRLRESELEHRGSYPLPFFGRGMCAVGNRVFVLGNFQDALVHEIGRTGNIVRSFAQPPRLATELLSKMSASNQLWCDTTNESIIIANHLRPNIHIYSLSGSLQHQRRIAPFREIVVATAGPGAVTYSEPKEGRYDVIVGVLSVEGRLLVQVGHDGPGDAITSVRTFELTDEGARQVRPSLPRMVKNVGNVALGKRTEPFPAATVFLFSW